MADGHVDTTPGPDVAEALEIIRNHASVVRADVVSVNASGEAAISADIDCALPSRSFGVGISPTGVRATETVTFQFGRTYPYVPPRITLRADFPRSLPHIQPGEAGTPVEPCIYFGDLGELLHSRGLGRLLHHLVAWLERAACNELISFDQGWEPIRRDAYNDIVEFDEAEIRNLITSDQAEAVVRGGLIRSTGIVGREFYGLVGSRPVPPPEFIKWLSSGQANGPIHTVAIIAWSNGPPNKNPTIANQYEPDNVTNLLDLFGLANRIGCGTPLRGTLAAIQKLGTKLPKGPLPLIVVLCARRPLNLIGSNNSIELMPYVVEGKMPDLLSKPDRTKARPMSHRQKVSPDLLRRMSGISVSLSEPKVVLIGCGSVGSKLALHLARSGLSPSRVVDKSWVLPHNAARHALVPTSALSRGEWYGSKANVLGEVLQNFGARSQASHLDVRRLVPGSTDFDNVFSGADIVINATGSLAVRAYLGTGALRSRVVEASLLAGGRFALMTIEGPNRNPTTLDLACQAYQAMAADVDLRQALSAENNIQSTLVGQGCSSLTMIMPDSLLSLQTASMAQRLLKMLLEGMPDSGEILIGRLGSDGVSLSPKIYSARQFTCIAPENAQDWSIRISASVDQKITTDTIAHNAVETGGVITGRVSAVERMIWITDVIDAPPDSVRSASEFQLGTLGLAGQLADARRLSGNSVYCVGTWHSHLSDQGGSPRDYQTAREVSTSSPTQLVLLIRRPSGYSALLAGSRHA